jgi:Zn-dependent M28 family amino/carboxypeptidase
MARISHGSGGQRRGSLRRALLAATALALLVASSAQAADRFNSTPYRNAVTVPNILQHEYKLQQFADNNGGTRVAGSPGNDRTVNYIASTMRGAGWRVKKQPFEFPFFQENSPAVFEQTAPTSRTFTDEEFQTMTYSGSGDVTAPIVPVDVVVPIGDNPPGTSNSGCDAADFDGFPAGAIALVQRGTCNFIVKVQNAEAAGAVAVIVFNEGQAPTETAPEDRRIVVAGTLGGPGATVPTIGTSYAIGEELVNEYRAGDAPAGHVKTDATSETRTTYNVIADAPWGDPNRTVVVSAHNDSVAAGPGINDDGSGTSMDLELARNLGLKGRTPTNHLRSIWVGAEEEGLLGSQFYVDSLTDAQKLKIIAMLDFDMVASPNYARQVYDGDGSTFGSDVSGPSGSGFIEGLFNDFFASQEQATEPIPFDGRSDYVAFTNAGIPAGGIFTGAEKPKTQEEADLFGGTVGLPLDPCYHQACDTVNTLNLKALGEMKNAAADVVYQLALIQGPIRDGRPVKPNKLANEAFKGELAIR